MGSRWPERWAGIRGGLVVEAAVGLGLFVSLGRDGSGADAPQRGRANARNPRWPAVGLQWMGKTPDGLQPSGFLLYPVPIPWGPRSARIR
ncbi:hypothetical protein NWFMUON74_72200 (plasmid) [Nocardia wallacei]|uniref:Uncharacterized protein n=1 Tax=Nocardia wallacei TaxID=480035 RepID=A0A7G1KW33_9NOCA|nr:hypothetical protein NWFMUON74_72200 [Nocardia wallacei]